MMNIEVYIERIEQYESGAMSTEERKGFEADLKSNADLQKAHSLFLQANDVIEQGIENNLRSQLQGWASEGDKTKLATKVVSMQSTWVRMAIAASVALLIGWFGFQWAGDQYSDQNMYASYYEQPDASSFRSGGSGQENPLDAGFEAVEAGDLNTALILFSNIPEDSEYYAAAQYQLGHLNLQLKDYPEAITAFQACAARSDSKYKEKAEWNLLLTYMAAGRTDTPEFDRLLSQILANPDHSYLEQAKKLSGELKSFWRKLAD